MTEQNDKQENRKPKSPFAIQTHTIEVPSVGSVTLKQISVGDSDDAVAATTTVPEQQKGRKFITFLLTRIIRNPVLTEKQIGELNEESLNTLGQVLVEDLGISKEFAETDETLALGDRIFAAHNMHWKELMGGFLISFQKQAQDLIPFQKQAQEMLKAMGSAYTESFKHLSVQNLISVPETSAIARACSQMMDVSIAIGRMIEPINIKLWKSVSEGVADQLAEVARSQKSLIATIAQYRPPEPFLFNGLIASGINSPIIHTPTYEFPEPVVIATREDFEEQRDGSVRQRLVDAYDILLQLELTLRPFLEESLESEYQDEWWERGVPLGVRNDCEERKDRREDVQSRKHHPIYYANLYQLKKIIFKGENWDRVFKAVFSERNKVEVSFDWLCRIRPDIAHPRPMSDEDYTRFTVECNWVQRLIQPFL